jgi:WD40 repeat protein
LAPKWTADPGTGTLRSVAVAGGKVAAGGSDKAVRVWDVESGKEVQALGGMTSLMCDIALSRDGHTLLAGGNPPTPVGRITAGTDCLLRAVPLTGGRPAITVGVHALPISCLALAPNGQFALTGCERVLRYWDVGRAKELRMYVGHTGTVKAVDFHPQFPRVARAVSVAADATARIWELSPPRVDRVIGGLTGSPHSASFSPDGKAILIAGVGILGTWDAASGKSLQTFTATSTRRGGAVDPVACACWAPDGNVIIGHFGGVALVDATTGKELQAFDGVTGTVSAVAASPDGRYVAAAGHGVILWELDKPLVPTRAEPPASGKAN